jgi:polar amino acid transport system substrate-binding protein
MQREDHANWARRTLRARHSFCYTYPVPKKNGKAAYEQITAVKPGIKVIFMSGYTADIIQSKGIINDGMPFLPKPIFPDQLLRKVREVLDA